MSEDRKPSAKKSVAAHDRPAAEARRLRLECNKLVRRLRKISDSAEGVTEGGALRDRIKRIVRELSEIRATSVHVAEAKMRVAMDLLNGNIDDNAYKLLSSVMSDLHNLSTLSVPFPTPLFPVHKEAVSYVGQSARIQPMFSQKYSIG